MLNFAYEAVLLLKKWMKLDRMEKINQEFFLFFFKKPKPVAIF